MATDLAPVTPEVLRWARENLGVSVEEAAKRAGVPEDRIIAWEAGEAEPTLAKLRALAKLYQRPISVFLLPAPPEGFDAMHDFRRLPGGGDRAWSRALHKVYRRALDQQSVAAEIWEADGEQAAFDVPTSSIDVSPEEAVSAARAALGVSLPEQISWRQPDKALAGWIEAVEGTGILVLRTSEVEFQEMRGFSVSTGPVPVIVLNALDWPRGQVFTLLHEFAHVILREGGLCDLLEPDSPEGRRVEAWCNAVAASIAMPADSVLDNDVVRAGGVRDWDEDVLRQLSNRYGVSQEAVIRRLVTLARASMAFYLTKRAEYQVAYDTAREEDRRQRSKSKGGPPPHRMAIRDRGKPYVRLVLDAYQRDLISLASAANLLSLKPRHFDALANELRP